VWIALKVPDPSLKSSVFVNICCTVELLMKITNSTFSSVMKGALELNLWVVHDNPCYKPE